MKTLPLLLVLSALPACSIRAVALVETGEASYNGATTISRKQDPSPQKQFSTLEGIIRGGEAYPPMSTPRIAPTPSLID